MPVPTLAMVATARRNVNFAHQLLGLTNATFQAITDQVYTNF